MPPVSEAVGDNQGTEEFKVASSQGAIFNRSHRHVVLSGDETEEQAREAEQIAVKLPMPPKFAGFADERRHRLQRLAIGFRLFSKYSFDEGVAGHMTCRDPEYPDLFWVNPFGVHFGQIKPRDLVLVDHEGELVRGGQSVNKAAFAIHSQIHAARSDAITACHTHSMYGKAFSSFARPLLPITQDACAFYNHHSVFDDYAGVVYDVEEGRRIASALGPTNKAVILSNHGLLTVGRTVEEAIWWFISMERCCQAQLLAEAASPNGYKGLRCIEDDVAKVTFDVVGTPNAGWFSLQPMCDLIIQEQPDCIEY
ncbi:hypothetical protein BZG36_03200 [Bifiguratus adelaidae]|uniref:Class II aldolase/adducin N-terminal domain-containing protein n=1 Tax=Bifiguratus adelaidae TaxID=1938954 RepID=A0A261Y191_9FUNG|nr:hypothetical protein BZG36_03200 [Bifiguratus adelaidae]